MGRFIRGTGGHCGAATRQFRDRLNRHKAAGKNAGSLALGDENDRRFA
jgi:hypothetical protein